uniref:(northern house mosquito) hypothetical protein n=1 Tax=Culex pipiens TaxID=7175 RepID=A0A8D8AXU4_CULPI
MLMRHSMPYYHHRAMMLTFESVLSPSLWPSTHHVAPGKCLNQIALGEPVTTDDPVTMESPWSTPRVAPGKGPIQVDPSGLVTTDPVTKGSPESTPRVAHGKCPNQVDLGGLIVMIFAMDVLGTNSSSEATTRVAPGKCPNQVVQSELVATDDPVTKGNQGPTPRVAPGKCPNQVDLGGLIVMITATADPVTKGSQGSTPRVAPGIATNRTNGTIHKTTVDTDHTDLDRESPAELLLRISAIVLTPSCRPSPSPSNNHPSHRHSKTKVS